MYDNICKFIVEEFSEDIATWLLGEPIELVELSAIADLVGWVER